MSTHRIHRDDVYARSNSCKVVDVIEQDGYDVVVTDASVYFPEGGGQPCDIGTISTGDRVCNVTSCYDHDLQGDVYHVTDAPSGTLHIGDVVTLSIDWQRRFSNMQRHLGEHMLSAVMYRLYGGVNKGFHMGEDYMTIDIDLGKKDLADGTCRYALSDEDLLLASVTVNQAIWQDLSVETTFYDSYEDSKVMPVRKDVPHDGKVSIVSIIDEDGGFFDCIACCGTHPSSTGQLGILHIYKHEMNKGMTRIYFDCGMKAYHRIQQEHGILSEIANKYYCLMRRI